VKEGAPARFVLDQVAGLVQVLSNGVYTSSSIYDKVLTEKWAQLKILSEAHDQVKAGKLHNIKIAYYCSNPSTTVTLNTFFTQQGIPITVKYFPMP
jgi:hypothetical protein